MKDFADKIFFITGGASGIGPEEDRGDGLSRCSGDRPAQRDTQ